MVAKPAAVPPTASLGSLLLQQQRATIVVTWDLETFYVLLIQEINHFQ